MESNVLLHDIVIPCYDTDVAFRLRPSSFMDYAQEIAQVHADSLGFGFDDLQKTKTVWVLSRMHVKFINTPLWRQKTAFATWHKGVEGLFYLRDFKMTDAQGNPAVLATSSWLIINVDTRRIVRDSETNGLKTAVNEHAIGGPAQKVRIPSGLIPEVVAEHQVAYSDVDMNGHTNNARYLNWTMDALPYDLVKSLPVKEMTINFNHETRPGEKVSIMRTSVPGENRYFVEGTVDGKSAFIVEILF